MPSIRLLRIEDTGTVTTVVSKSGLVVEIGTLDLEPGRYRLSWQYGGDRGREEFVLKDGDKLKAQLDLAPGTIFADISSIEAGAGFEIENLLTGETLRLHSSSGVLNATVPPGPYRVTASRGELGSSKELVVHGGEVERVRIGL